MRCWQAKLEAQLRASREAAGSFESMLLVCVYTKICMYVHVLYIYIYTYAHTLT